MSGIPTSLARLHPRRAGLRMWLGLTYGVMAIGLVGVIAWFAERAASEKLRDDIGLRLSISARALADRVDEGVYERLNDVLVLAMLPVADDPVANQELLRDLFGMMQVSYPDLVWIGVADVDGEVQVASRGLLEGENVGERPWFQAGRREPFVGDIRDAVLLAKVLPRTAGETLRLIDFSAPIRDDFGATTGVLGVHLSAQWAETLRLHLMQTMGGTDPLEVLILDRERRVLVGPAPWRGQVLEVDSALASQSGRTGAELETWPDGERYLTGYATTSGRAPFDGLGWTILVREDAAVAFSPVAELRRQIWWAALFSALVFLLGAVILARMIGAPLIELADAARRIQGGDPDAAFPRERGYREARQLTSALRALFEELTGHERELTAMTHQLEQRVRERTLELSDANAQLEVLAMTDALTGLANRRHFGDELAREVTRAAEAGKPVALVAIDIDHFKVVNDEHGHPAGDAVLRRVAMLLEEQVRGNDLLARVGGEEFAVLAVGAAVAEASQLAERLRSAIENAGPISVGRTSLAVTVSVGVSVVWPRPGDILKVPERLLGGADDALYRAKRNGRNRVEVAAP